MYFEQFHEKNLFIWKINKLFLSYIKIRLDEGKPDAKDVINELIEGVDLKQSVHEEDEAERKL